MKTFINSLKLLSLFCLSFTTLAQDGNLDTSFDTDGIATAISDPAAAATDRAFGVALQTDGKLLVSGDAQNGSNRKYFIVRFNTNGSLDNTFGTNGVISGFIGASTNTTGSTVRYLSSGKILLGGSTTLAGEQRWHVTRFNSDGTIDNTFGTSGSTIIDFSPSTISQQLTDIKIAQDGKIFVAGNYNTAGSNQTWAVARLTENGSLDTTFNNGGAFGISTSIVLGQFTECSLTPDGKILLTGRIANSGSWHPGIVRLNNNGSIDSTFSGDGVEFYPISGRAASNAFDIKISPDRSIFLAGIASTVLAGNASDDMFVLKVNPNGGLNTPFGTAGIATFDLTGGFADQAYSLELLSNGKILVGGTSLRTSLIASRDMAIIRLNSNGTLDNTFGTLAGRTFVDAGGSGEDFGYNLMVRPNGKVIGVGAGIVGNKIRALAAQLNGTVPPLVVTGLRPELKGISTLSISVNSVSLQATVSAGATSSTTTFQVSTSVSFGSITGSTSVLSGSGTSDTTINGTVSGLSAGIPYYARAVSSNNNGNDTSATIAFIINNILPVDSLALWLRADVGVTTSNGTLLTGWVDLSPKSNNVGITPGISQPTLVNSAVNGLPAVRFDGVNDFLTSSKHLDVRNGPSIFIVAKNAVRKDVNAFLKISATHTQVNSHMDFYWQAGTGGNGNLVYAANRPTSGFGGLAKARIYSNLGTVNTYYLASCVVPNNISASGFFLGDSLTNPTDNGTGVFLAQGTDLAQIGVLPPTGSFLNGDIAEMIVYNRPLSTNERRQVEAYLSNKYNILMPNFTPTVTTNNASNVTSTSATLNAVITPKSLSIDWQFEYDTLSDFSTASTSSLNSLPAGFIPVNVNAPVSNLISGRSYFFRVKVITPFATYLGMSKIIFNNTEIPSSNLVFWIRSDVGVNASPQGKVTQLVDLARGIQLSSPVGDTAQAPSLISNGLNSRPVMRFDGSDYLVGDADFPTTGAGRTLFVVAKNRIRKNHNGIIFHQTAAPNTNATVFESYWQIGTSNNASGNLVYGSNRPSSGTSNAFFYESPNVLPPVDNFYLLAEQYRNNPSSPNAIRIINGSPFSGNVTGNGNFRVNWSSGGKLYVGAGLGGVNFSSSQLDGDIAEIIMYDSFLPDSLRIAITDYLNAKYNVYVPPAPTITLGSNPFAKQPTGMNFTFQLNNQNVDGAFQIQYSTQESFASFDTLSRESYVFGGNTTVNYTRLIPVTTTNMVYHVRVVAANVGGIDTSQVRAFMSPSVSFNDANIKAWLRADANTYAGTSPNNILDWYPIRTGSNTFTHLTSPLLTTQPGKTINAINGHPSLWFTGSNRYLRDAGGLLSLQDFTISVVFKASSPAGMVYEHSLNSNTQDGSYLFTTNNSTINVRRFSVQSSKSLSANWGTNNTYRIVTHAFGGGNQNNLMYINGQLQTLSNNQAGNPGGLAEEPFFLGSRAGSSLFLNGEIAEVIISGDFLQGADLDSMHAYLSQRYNIGIITGIGEHLETLNERGVSVWPNPFNETFRIAMNKVSGKAIQLTVFDLAGNRLLERTLTDIQEGVVLEDISSESLKSGLYILEVNDSGSIKRLKLIKE